MAQQIIFRTPARIDANTSAAFEAEVKKGLEQSPKELLFDLDDTVYVSSAGLRVFLFAQKKVNAQGASMALTHIKPQIMEIFEVTGLSGVFSFV